MSDFPRIEFGVREFIILAATLIREYARHQENIDPKLNDVTANAMHVLLAALPELLAMNAYGPNPVSGPEGGTL